MNFQAARAAMVAGQKVRYKSWWWGRYIYMEGKKILHENGVPVGIDAGFTNGKLDWEIYDEAKHGAHNERPATSGSDVCKD